MIAGLLLALASLPGFGLRRDLRSPAGEVVGPIYSVHSGTDLDPIAADIEAATWQAAPGAPPVLALRFRIAETGKRNLRLRAIHLATSVDTLRDDFGVIICEPALPGRFCGQPGRVREVVSRAGGLSWLFDPGVSALPLAGESAIVLHIPCASDPCDVPNQAAALLRAGKIAIATEAGNGLVYRMGWTNALAAAIPGALQLGPATILNDSDVAATVQQAKACGDDEHCLRLLETEIHSGPGLPDPKWIGMTFVVRELPADAPFGIVSCGPALEHCTPLAGDVISNITYGQDGRIRVRVAEVGDTRIVFYWWGTAAADLRPEQLNIAVRSGTVLGFAGTLVPRPFSADDVAFPDVSVGRQAEQHVRVTNWMNGSTGYSTFASGPFNIGASTCGQTVLPGDACDVWIRFVPVEDGPREETFGLQSDSSGADSLPITGRGKSPVAGLSPSAWNFGEVQLGAEGSAESWLSNTGVGELDVTALDLSGDAAEFNVVNGCTVVPAGGSCPIRVEFRPTTAGARGATLTISHDGAGDSQITLAGTGVDAGPQTLAADPPGLEFGAAAVGVTTPARTVTVTNPGAAVSFHPVPPPGFVITSACSVLLHEQSCPIGIAFAPYAAGSFGGALAMVDPLGRTLASVALTGTGIASHQLLIAPAAIDFGTQAAGTGGPPRSVRVFNPGPEATAIEGATVPPGFSFTSSCPASLAAGAECGILVRFAPVTDQVISGPLALLAGGETLGSVALSGIGVSQAASNDEPSAALSIEVTPFDAVLDVGATTASPADPVATCDIGSHSHSVWFVYTPVANGIVTLTAAGSSYDTVVSVWDGDTEVACNDDDGQALSSALRFEVAASHFYRILVTDYANTGGILRFHMAGPAPAQVADLGAVFTMPTAATLSESVPITLTVTNNSAVHAAANGALTIRLPAPLLLLDAAEADRGRQCAIANATVSCALGTVLPAEQIKVTMASHGNLAANVASAAATVTAQLSSSQDPNLANDMPAATITLERRAELAAAALTLTPLPSHAAFFHWGADTGIAVHARIANAGPDVAATATATLQIPIFTQLRSAPPECLVSGQNLICQVMAIGPGGGVEWQFDFDPLIAGLPAEWNASLQVSDPGVIDPITTNNVASATLPVKRDADVELSITPVTQTTVVGPHFGNGDVTLNLNAVNHGPNIAHQLEVHEVLPAGWTAVAPVPAGCEVAGREVICRAGTGTVGEVFAYPLRLRPPAPLVSPTTALHQLSIRAGDNVDTHPENDSVTATVAVFAEGDLRITGAVAPVTPSGLVPAGEALVGETVRYSLRITNGGTLPAADVRVTLALPPGVQFVQATSAAFACAANTCTAPQIAAGGVALLTIDAALTAAALSVPRAMLAASFAVDQEAGAGGDPDPGNNGASAALAVNAAMDLVLDPIGITPPLFAGQPISLALRITNQGPSPALAPVLTVPLGPESAEAAPVLDFASLPDCSIHDGGTPNAELICNLPDLAASDSITVLARLTSGAPGMLHIGGRAQSAGIELRPGDNAVVTTGLLVQSPLEVAPAAAAFGSVLRGETRAISLVLKNVSPRAVALGALAIDLTEFAVASDCPATLAPGDSCPLTVRFHPVTTGMRSGTMTLVSTGGKLSVPLLGTGFDVQLSLLRPARPRRGGQGSTAMRAEILITGLADGPVQLACAGMQFQCGFSPERVRLDGGSHIVTVMIEGRRARAARFQRLPLPGCVTILATVGSATRSLALAW